MAAAPLPPCSILRFPSTTSGSVSSMSNSSFECLNNPRSILDFPAEILTIIAIELVMNQPSQRYRALKTNQLGNLLRLQARKSNLIEFKELLNFGLTCKHLHSICQRIYQKQVVLTLPSTKHTSSQLSQQWRRDQRERAHSPSGHPYTRTIETHDSVARGWSGAHNVHWLFISNQASYEPKYSAMFAGLISSTARLARSFLNLRFLCLSRLNNETILLCLERGVGKSLQALSITLSEVEDSESSLRGLANRIMRLRTISHLEAIQVNDIEPTWVGLINQVDNLKEISLHITNFTPKIVQLLDSQASLQKLEIFGGVRDTRLGPSFFQLLHQKFPKIEVLKCGLHSVGKHNDYHGEVSHYATALARFSYLRQFVFNHFNSPQLLEYFDGSSATESVFQKFRSYSEPYLHESQSLQELISIDFLDRNSMSGISAQKTHSGSDNRRITTNSCTKSDRADSNGVLKVLRLDEYPCGLMLKTSHEPISRSADKNPERSGRPSIRMRKIHDVRDTIMVSFEHRWAKID
ncbi:hypothetical protein MJO29_011322 [Puccinia striiformis f. sp. tritici]|uniref:Uncharacterized protein n=2 Tax=Puccinia striiformis f. sp. tritici TaxID=168172 RepID=A0A0L0VPH2_9BASI|nr:hypothetical protein MJO29_011322 [Puccinia striiformis f. sp. tritici]KAI9599696.1 hypothetical protein KEM48_008911 [Puccinia striiformis f. sp. tritici PST-130]KAI9614819.1 hypothetical protein H4Q26_009214 [Puccinia striiformis f. sp. tritici PST-130]KNF01166.1 hypothetical protein PSTG_05520 [Puccinia striiformis f. sp. tritici PST-78]